MGDDVQGFGYFGFFDQNVVGHWVAGQGKERPVDFDGALDTEDGVALDGQALLQLVVHGQLGRVEDVIECIVAPLLDLLVVCCLRHGDHFQ